MRGKYSPTVSAAYMADQSWWTEYSGVNNNWVEYDPEGYDSYGYNADGKDRAGNQEYVYYENNAPEFSDCDYNWKFDAAYDAWGFDGTKPVPTVLAKQPVTVGTVLEMLRSEAADFRNPGNYLEEEWYVKCAAKVEVLDDMISRIESMMKGK